MCVCVLYHEHFFFEFPSYMPRPLSRLCAYTYIHVCIHNNVFFYVYLADRVEKKYLTQLFTFFPNVFLMGDRKKNLHYFARFLKFWSKLCNCAAFSVSFCFFKRKCFLFCVIHSFCKKKKKKKKKKNCWCYAIFSMHGLSFL